MPKLTVVRVLTLSTDVANKKSNQIHIKETSTMIYGIPYDMHVMMSRTSLYNSRDHLSTLLSAISMWQEKRT